MPNAKFILPGFWDENGGLESAFEVTYKRYSDRIYSMGLRYLKSPILAQDLVQEVFLKLWMEMPKFHSYEYLEAWLITVAKNKLINQVKKTAKEALVLNDFKVTEKNYSEIIVDDLNLKQQRNILKEAIGKLSHKQKQVFHLVKEEELSYKQVGKILNMSPLTVKTHMSRSIKQLKLVLTKIRML